jgi:hypothetical protein
MRTIKINFTPELARKMAKENAVLNPIWWAFYYLALTALGWLLFHQRPQILLLMCVLIYPLILIFSYRRAKTRLLRIWEQSFAYGDLELRFTEEGIESHGLKGSGTLRWGMIQSVKKTQDLFIIFLAFKQPVFALPLGLVDDDLAGFIAKKMSSPVSAVASPNGGDAPGTYSVHTSLDAGFCVWIALTFLMRPVAALLFVGSGIVTFQKFGNLGLAAMSSLGTMAAYFLVFYGFTWLSWRNLRRGGPLHYRFSEDHIEVIHPYLNGTIEWDDLASVRTVGRVFMLCRPGRGQALAFLPRSAVSPELEQLIDRKVKR